jgi:DNA-binding SARP family transcriptional activator
MGAPTLRIRLLGELDLRYGEAPLPPLESARAGSLLAYLLLHRQAPQSRQRLAFLLWPDSTEPQARTNLRHVLHTLRRALPEPDQFIEVTPRTLWWRAEAPFWLDVAAFEEAVSRAEREAAGTGLAAWREAVDLYTGDLLEGCYDEWLLGERERLRQCYLEALDRLTTLLEARGQHAEAIPYAERLLRHDPLHEETYRLLMRLHDARGDRARALWVYHVCTATLQRELGIEPSAQTHAAYEALLPPGRDAVGGQAERTFGSPLVGRASERARLASLWRAAERGQAQFVLVSGEPGIGKTRLVEEFRSWCAHRGATTAGARAYAAEGALAYGPIVSWLRSDAIGARVEGLNRPHLTELARLLPELLTSVPGLARPEPLPEGEQRQRLFDAIARALLAADGPLLLVADDLHWYDRETLQFLHYLLRVAPDARLLVAATARREELVPQHPLHDLLAGLRVLERSTEIELGRLTRGETATLAERLTGRPLEEAGADQLFDETEGSPLFVVEALRTGWRPGQTRRAWLNSKVQAVIEARLAQLSTPARDLVGVAATIGREFTAEVLARASEADETVFVRSLDELWQRRLVREHGIDAYDFSHDTIREVAYLTLSPAQRRHHHLRVARALERLHAHEPGPVSGQIAAHYDRARAADQAIPWYGRAADAALQLYASPEAVRLLERALDLLRALPETAERRARELTLLTALPAPLVAIEGYQSSRMTAVQQRALDLTRALGIEPAPALLRSLAIASLSGDDFAGTRRFAEQLRARGARDADDVLLVEGDYVLGVAAFWRGEFHAAREHFESAIAHYRPEHRHAHLLRYAQDPNVVCLTRLACALWFLGHPEAAIRARDAGLTLAEEIGHPFTLMIALVFATLLSLELCEPERLRAYVVSLAAPGGEREGWHRRSVVEALLGYVDVLNGRAAAGIARIRSAIDSTPIAAPTPGHHAILQRVLLAACAVAGETRTGLAAAERLLAMGDTAGLWQAEAHRMRAEFLAALGASEREVAAELDRALRVARSQGARSLELRAATSLLRHRLARGESQAVRAARDLLATLLDSFHEGRDTHDLRQAAALLAQT